MRSDCESLMVLLLRSRMRCCPRYLVFITGPKEINLIDFDIFERNQLYNGTELEMARPLLTWIGKMRKRVVPGWGRGMEECGGVVHCPMKTAWSASHRRRPKLARIVERSLYHSCDNCFRPYKATSSRRTVEVVASG